MQFSIVIPYYNGQRFLPTLTSVIDRLANSDIEVVIVDDFSDPAEYEALVVAGASRGWIIIRNSENLGPGPTRNRGLQEASGEYIVFLDSDDKLADQTIAVLADAVHDAHPDVILFDVQQVTPRSSIRLRMVPENTRGFVEKDRALAYCRSMTAGKCYRRDFIVDNCIKFGSMKRHEDTAFTKAALALANTVFYVPDTLYTYVISEGSLIKTSSNASMEASFVMWDQIRSTVENINSPSLQYVFISEVVISCALKIRSLGLSNQEAHALFNRFDKVEPGWNNNPYLKQASLRYRLIAHFVTRRRVTALRALLSIESLARIIVGNR